MLHHVNFPVIVRRTIHRADIRDLGYQSLHGFSPANYSMPGSPAGLARIDQLLGINIYSSSFSAAPLVFGAMPSLHSGIATIEALFLSQVFPRARWLFYAYTAWVWWATLYLQHHYAVDLIAGSLRMYNLSLSNLVAQG